MRIERVRNEDCKKDESDPRDESSATHKKGTLRATALRGPSLPRSDRETIAAFKDYDSNDEAHPVNRDGCG
ncbi:MAG: hypothetical protein NVSMB14_00080 [Isosphaeraceae bacterium]